MTKQEALKIIKLLSALESWAFSTKNMLPEYLHDNLNFAVEKLEVIVLEKNPAVLNANSWPKEEKST